MRLSIGRSWFLVLSAWLATGAAGAQEFTGADIGNPSQSGTVNTAAGAVQLSAGGWDIGGTADQCFFAFRPVEGDFDVRVRVDAIAGGDLWSKAGIMARASLEPGSPAFTVAATPSLLGTLMISRSSAGTAATIRGGFPSAFPRMWLRLQRTNDSFNAYAGVDGQVWTALGSASYPAAEPMSLGLAASSHASNAVVRTVFADFSATPAADVTGTPLLTESPGPSTRKTGWAITEIMYHPARRADGKNLEFIELFNSNPFFEDLGEYRLTGDIDYTFPKGTVVPGGGFVVVAKVPADVQAVYGLAGVLGPYEKALKPGGTVRLRNKIEGVLLEVPYTGKSPWPVAADGTGHSLVLSRPSYGEANPEAWDASYARGGSPGRVDPPRVGAWHQVVINEYHGGSGPADAGFIEFYNRNPRPVDLSGGFLSDDPATHKYRIPAGTVLAARGYAVFDAGQLGFPLTPAGAAIYWSDPEDTRVIQAARFGAQAPGASIGHAPDGGGEYYPLAAPTPGAANRESQSSPVVINEIMCHPISEDDDDQYVELFNRGAQAADLGGWKFVDGIDFTFPAGTTIPAGGYLVVARNAARLQTNYGNLNPGNLAGNFAGRLARGGEHLALGRPVVFPDPAGQGTQTAYAVVDETTYHTGGRWGQWANGGGSSLELIDARANRRRASNWGDSDETKKAPWTTVEAAGVLDHGAGAVDSLHVLLLGAGECLLDNVGVFAAGNATNLVMNSDFERGLASWSVLGDHVRSGLETEAGDQSAQSLCVRASNNGDTGANRIRAQLAARPRLSEGQTATLRARVRWLRGFPEILLRLKGNYLEAFGRLEVPRNLGTPGAANSRALPNTGPAISDVTHSPAVPAADQPVLVSARVDDPDGVAAVTLRYRIDPSTNAETLALLDDGTGGDAQAGDGFYSATLPGQASGKLVAFRVEALDQAGAAQTSVFPADAPRRECLVRFGDAVVSSGFGTYRLWMTAATVSNWVNRPVLSNEELDLTFVYGNQRVVYNASGRLSGSPWHQSAYNSPVGPSCTYAVSVPEDDRVLGTTSFNKIHAPGNTPSDDATIQCEQTAYWMVRQFGLPANYQRYVLVYVNGLKRGSLMEDTQVPSGETIQEHFPEDPDGPLYKLGGWYEYDDGRSGALGFSLISWCTLNKYTTTGGAPKLARYRWNWAPRAVGGTANNFADVIALTEAADNPNRDTFRAGLEARADTDQWLRTFAIEHAVGNWDSFGNRNAQNMYAYKPKGDKWKLVIWDFNIVLGNSGSDGPTGDNLFQYHVGDRGMGHLYADPTYQRAYLRHLKAIAEGPMMNAALVNPLLDARFAAFKASGVSVSSPNNLKNWIASRQKYLTSYLTNFAVPFGFSGGIAGELSTNQNWFTLTGTAPLEVATVRVNGMAYPVTWSDALNWSVRVPLAARDNSLIVRGYDGHGLPVAGAALTLTAHLTGELESPAGLVVINEIMYRPATPRAEYVELFNTSSRSLFDLSRYRISGIDGTLPDGTLIGPGGYLVVARDRLAFMAAYGNRAGVAGEFAGQLDNQGETLRLFRPGATPEQDVTIDEVTYRAAFPWPAAANGEGGSLQLLDPRRDHQRPDNWGAITPAEAAAPQWRFVSVTGVAAADHAKLLLYHSPYQAPREPGDVAGTWSGTIAFPGSPYQMSIVLRKQGNTWAGDFLGQDGNASLVNILVKTNAVSFGIPVQSGSSISWKGTLSADGKTLKGNFTQSGPGYSSSAPFSLALQKGDGQADGGGVFIDDLQLVPGAVPAAGANRVRNGGFEEPLAGTWQVASNHAASAVAATWTHSGRSALELVATLGGKDENTAVWQAIDGLVPGQPYTLSYWYLPSTNGVDLTVRLTDTELARTETLEPDAAATPGRANSIRATVADLPLLYLTEIQPENPAGIADSQGRRAPWVELYNAGTNTVVLDDYWLAGDAANLRQWPFPDGAAILPGQYRIVWLDGAETESTTTEWHAGFRPSPTNGIVILSREISGVTTVVDSFAYEQVMAGQSFGRLDDQKAAVFERPTPGQPNQLASSVDRLVINEWMADNEHVPVDLAGGMFPDWFELYNPNDRAVDLRGYRLSDSLTNAAAFVIGAGYSIAARGYLVVWADGHSELNAPAIARLHVNFKLDRNGETIALFAPEGGLIDAVTYGRQSPDISQGWNARGELVFMSTPTPGQENIASPVAHAVPFRITDWVRSAQGGFRLEWASEPGWSYQVQYRNANRDAAWINLGAPVTAAGGFATVFPDDSPQTASQRFYRVMRIGAQP